MNGHLRYLSACLKGADFVAKPPKCLAIVSRKLTKRAAIAGRCRLQAVTEIACEFIADYVVPQMFIRSPRVRSGKFVLVDAKRLLQQNPPNPDVGSSRAMAGSVAVDRQLPQCVGGGCGAEFVGQVLVDDSHQALAGAGCSYSAALAH
jgi:hypothetical protein